MLGESILLGLLIVFLYLSGAKAETMLGYGAGAWIVLAFFARRARKVKGA